MNKSVVHIANLHVQYTSKVILQDLNWQIERGENWLISGPSGTGKSTLAQAIAGLIPYTGEITVQYQTKSDLKPQVLIVSNWYEFSNLEGDKNFYYQQRYNKQQKNDTLTVYAELQHYAKENDLTFDTVEAILVDFGFENFREAQLIELSSGEHKKLQLIKALWLRPEVLIIDQPYTGLDRNTRLLLDDALNQLTACGSTLLIIINDQQIPECVHHYAEIKNGQLVEIASQKAFSKEQIRAKKTLPFFLQQKPKVSADILVKMTDVHVSYGEKVILKGINWEVKSGEKWLLQGHNGSGKSTLLSLINGDHPQAYANNLILFGKKRGSGESIWDIKSHLGIISPEMHWYFDPNAKVWQSIASGFFDSVGLFRNLSYEKQLLVDQILEFFDLIAYKNDLLSSLPLGKQRLALLARTVIKNPELLILDEPCQGLDEEQTKQFNLLVDELCNYGKTLIYVGHFENQIPHCIEKKIILEHGQVLSIAQVLQEA